MDTMFWGKLLFCVLTFLPPPPNLILEFSSFIWAPFYACQVFTFFIKVFSWIYFQTFSTFVCDGIWQFYFCLSNLYAPFSSCASWSCFTCCSLERRLFDSQMQFGDLACYGYILSDQGIHLLSLVC